MSKIDDAIKQKTCKSVAYVPLRISTPISLKPHIRKLPISAEICGEPELTPTHCGTYILTQTLRVRVPIEIDITAKIGKSCLRFRKPPIWKMINRPYYDNIGPPNVVIGRNISCYVKHK